METEGAKALNWRGLAVYLLICAGLVVMTLVVARVLDISPYGVVIAVGVLAVINGIRILRNQTGLFRTRRVR